MGRLATCGCGLCQKCKRRLYKRRYRAKLKGTFTALAESELSERQYQSEKVGMSIKAEKQPEPEKRPVLQPVKPKKNPEQQAPKPLPNPNVGVKEVLKFSDESPLIHGKSSKSSKEFELIQVGDVFLPKLVEKPKRESWLSIDSVYGEQVFKCTHCGKWGFTPAIDESEGILYCPFCWSSQVVRF